MAAEFPVTIRVKLSSEDAGAVSITPVVAREMPVRELIGLMLDAAGKDVARVQDLLGRGTLVSGATRYRWQGWQAGVEGLREMLDSFPDPEPDRPFAPRHCVDVLFRGPRFCTRIPRDALAGRTLFGRASFWDALLRIAGQAQLEYGGYSYREHSDRYRLSLSAAQREQLKEGARLIRYTELRAHVRSGLLSTIEFFVRRDDANSG